MLQTSRSRNEKRLHRSGFEKEKAAEKISKLKAKFEADVQRVEMELQEKLDAAQSKIDEEVSAPE
jgi:hypothetical protein